MGVETYTRLELFAQLCTRVVHCPCILAYYEYSTHIYRLSSG
jgi:hypothetical protein